MKAHRPTQSVASLSRCLALGMLSLAHLNAVPVHAQIPGQLLGRFDADSALDAPPAIGPDGTVFIGTRRGTAYALEMKTTPPSVSFNVKWQGPTSGTIRAAPVVGPEGTLYLGCAEFNRVNFYAVDAATGTTKWSANLVGRIYVSPAVSPDGIVCVGGDDGRFFGLIASNGTTKWFREDIGDALGSPVIGPDGTLFVGTSGGSLVALNHATGEIKWRYATGDGIGVAPALGPDGTIYVGSTDNSFYAIRPDGTLKWSFAAGSDVVSSAAIGADGSIYFGAANNRLFSLKPDGSKRWEFLGVGDIASAPTLGSDGEVYFGDYRYYAVNTRDGSARWSPYNKGNSQLYDSAAFTREGILLVGAKDGRLYAFNAYSGVSGDSPWPMYLHDVARTGRVAAGNQPPVLAPIGDQVVNEGEMLSIRVKATDADQPAQQLSFSLDPGAPAGASITTDGTFNWTPSETQGPATYSVTIRVTDSGEPLQGAAETVSIKVAETNRLPSFEPVPNQLIAVGESLALTLAASDPDRPKQRLTFGLDAGAPPGASVSPDGHLTWTPTSAQTGTHVFTVRVSDDGAPSLSVAQSFAVTVKQTLVGEPPRIVTQPAAQTVSGGANLFFRVVATGTPPLLYQWRFNGVNLANETSDLLLLGNVTLTNSGLYRVIVANPFGVISSVEAELRVTGPPVPLADNFADRGLIIGPSGSGVGDNAAATQENGERAHDGKPGGKSVWLRWRAPTTGVATFKTAGSAFDTLLAVYTGTTLPALKLVAGDDDRGGALTSFIEFNTVAGQEYAIAIDGFARASGNIVLSWDLVETSAPLPEIVTPPTSQAVRLGANASFNVAATGAGPLTYQWLFNGAPIPGATALALNISQVSAEDVGFYSVQVTAGPNRMIESLAAALEIGGEVNVLTEDKLENLFPERPRALASLHRLGRGLMGFVAPALGTGGTQLLSNRGATTQAREPNPCDAIGGSSKWFRLRPEHSGRIEVSTAGSEIDTVLTVFKVPADREIDLDSIERVACDDNGESDGLRSRLAFIAEKGTDYALNVDGVRGAQGLIVINWQMAPLIESANGGLHFRRSVPAGRYAVEMTTDWKEWVPLIATNIFETPMEFLTPSDQPMQFFRMRRE